MPALLPTNTSSPIFSSLTSGQLPPPPFNIPISPPQPSEIPAMAAQQIMPAQKPYPRPYYSGFHSALITATRPSTERESERSLMARVCVSATAAVLTSFSACFGGFGRRRSVSPGARGDRIPPLTHNDNQCSRRTGATLHTHTHTHTLTHTHTKSNIKRTVDKASLSPSQSAFLPPPPSVKERKLLAKLSFVRSFRRHSPNTLVPHSQLRYTV